MATVTRNRRMTREERSVSDQDALGRIVTNFSMANFTQVIMEFEARGIPADEILPKENVFTYKAWRALGRQVRKGEKGVRITSWVHKDPSVQADGSMSKGRTFAVTAVVFHVSQTDVIGDKEGE